MKLRVIITGSTGMVGEGVLLSSLDHTDVEKILVINRRPCGIIHPKLKEIIHPDFYDITPIENELTGYNACFFCLGVSSIGMNEADYTRATYILTMHVATIMAKHNPNMVFSYISGVSTDSTEKGRQMWARVKGKTENDLMKLPFKKVYAFRPGFIKPVKGQRFVGKWYKYVSWLYPILRTISPRMASTVQEIALAMIHVSAKGYEKPVLEVKDINILAKR